MISENSLFLLMHRTGRYLARGYDGAIIWRLTNDPLDACRAGNREALWQNVREYYWDRSLFSVVPGPVCACCGDVQIVRHCTGRYSPYRCAKHAKSNPCAIEGCGRTRSAPDRADGTPYLANDQTICPEHWKRYIPARSRARRAYHAHFRRAKRLGWDDKRERAFWLFWRRLVAMARRRAAEGHIDEAEINRLMGWTD